MCVVVYKPYNTDTPKESLLEECWEANPDGAGFMVLPENSSKVYMQKGFMTFEGLMAALNDLNLKKTDIVAYHFRIATSGGINPSMCHPFPVSKAAEQMMILKGSAKRVFMHNGIIGPGKGNLSDTALYVLGDLSRKRKLADHQEEIARETTGSRTLTFDAEEGILMTGSWTQENGLYLSNTHFKWSSPLQYFYGHWRETHGKTHKKENEWIEDHTETYQYPTKTYYKVSNEETGFSTLLYKERGCGFGYKGTAYCRDCKHSQDCTRFAKFVEQHSGQLCEDGYPVVSAGAEWCKYCPDQFKCQFKAITPPTPAQTWRQGVGWCIGVF